MKSNAYLFLLLIFFMQAKAQDVDWKNPKVFDVNKLKPHAEVVPFDNVENALDGEIEHSRYYKSLNGKWKFKWVRNPNDRPIDFLKKIIM